MSRRIEVELTSQLDDETWTWRAAGAKQPKGTLPASLLYDGVKVGDVVRADAEFDIDGILVTAVLPPKSRSGRPDDERIELLGGGGSFEGVTTQLQPGGRRDRDGGGRGRRRDRGERGERGDRRGRGGGDRGRRDRDGGERGDRGGRGRGDRERGGRRPRRDESDAPSRPKPPKLRPGREHRKALIESLPEAQRVVAEQVSRGGIAAVRKEIETQNERAASEGGPEVKAEALIALAESLVPQLREAEWRDRADAALAAIDEVDLRDLRTVVVTAEDAARDPEARAVAEQLRDGLNARVDRAQAEWLDEIRATLADGRVVRALRVSSRPPKAGSPLPPDIAEQLTAAANEALTGDITQHRLGVVLDAVAYSPVRPYVVLQTVPAEPTDELMETIRKLADRLPEIAARFGVTAAPRRRGRGRGKGRGPKGPRPAGTPAEETPSADAPPGDETTPAAEETPAADSGETASVAEETTDTAPGSAETAPGAEETAAADAGEAAATVEDAPAADAGEGDASPADGAEAEEPVRDDAAS